MFAFQVRTSPLALFVLDSESFRSSSLPAGWQIKVNHGKPEVSASREGDQTVLRLRSDRASFGVERSIDVDVAAMPWLTWRWKVTDLPPDGDFRSMRTDDQAAQVLVAFADRHVLTYIWDSKAPKGLLQSTSTIPLVHVFAIVCRSGSTDLNQWLAEVHNVADDYSRAYGRPAPRVKGLRIQINSQHTGATAESYFGQVAFRSTPQ